MRFDWHVFFSSMALLIYLSFVNGEEVIYSAIVRTFFVSFCIRQTRYRLCIMFIDLWCPVVIGRRITFSSLTVWNGINLKLGDIVFITFPPYSCYFHLICLFVCLFITRYVHFMIPIVSQFCLQFGFICCVMIVSSKKKPPSIVMNK